MPTSPSSPSSPSSPGAPPSHRAPGARASRGSRRSQKKREAPRPQGERTSPPNDGTLAPRTGSSPALAGTPLEPPFDIPPLAPELAGPLDRALRAITGASWGRARSWIAEGKVRVGGEVVTDPTVRVVAGALVRVDTRAPRRRGVGGALKDSDVVYVDTHVVVINKPPGVSTVPYDETEADTLEARVRAWLERRGGVKGRARGRPPLGIVHRLDKETSGLVVFARTWLAKQRLALQFRQHTVERRYVAVIHGMLGARTIRTWLMEDRGDGLRGSAKGQPPPGAREAITHVAPVATAGRASLVSCRLETGRTHQIRIHLSEAGHPIVGERVYVRGLALPRIDAPRLMLHAVELGFVHPSTERSMRWEAPIPDDMQRVWDALSAP